jgi:hypothetical protein
MVFNSRGGYLTAEARVRLIEGDDVPDLSVRLFRRMNHIEDDAPADTPIRFGAREMAPDEMRQFMREDNRLIYELEPLRAYGMM